MRITLTSWWIAIALPAHNAHNLLHLCVVPGGVLYLPAPSQTAALEALPRFNDFHVAGVRRKATLVEQLDTVSRCQVHAVIVAASEVVLDVFRMALRHMEMS
jgi:hypothetical protein